MGQDVKLYGGARGGVKARFCVIFEDDAFREALKRLIREEVVKRVEAVNADVRLLAHKPAKNKPWYQQHDKRKWK